MKRIILAVALSLTNATLSSVVFAQASRGKSSRQSGTRSVPLVDHHQHLFSPAKAKTVFDPPLPSVALPADLARVVSERVRAWNDQTALAALYAEDALLLNTQDEDFPTWMRGRAAVAEELSRYFDEPYRITPVAYRADERGAHVAGYYTRGEGEAERHFGHVFLALVKAREGGWLISAETPTFPGPFAREPGTGEQLVAQLDDAGISRAVVLSVAYQWGSGREVRPGEYERVKSENDYTARQVEKYPSRLVGFCAFNPLRDYALEELERCRNVLHLKGLKLHFGNSRVELRNAEHVEKVRRVFAAANARRVPVVVHLWTLNKDYGREDAELFLGKILPAAPDITIQIAHMAGGGNSTPAALAVYADAIAKGDPRTKNLYFDVATLTRNQSAAALQQDAEFMRKIGLRRILYGTDTSPPNPPARVSWANFRGLVPLTDEEFKVIASNVAPYLR